MIFTTELAIGHGLTIFDEDLEPLPRVQEFCTETFLCCLQHGGKAVAAGYVIPICSAKEMWRYCNTLPASVLKHIFPEIIDSEDEEQKERLLDFCQQQVQHRKTLKTMEEKP